MKMLDKELLEYFTGFEPEDVPTYDEVLDDYWDECPKEVYEETKEYFLKRSDEIDIYRDARKEYIQLSDNATLFYIDLPESVATQITDDVFNEEYIYQVNRASDAFETITGEELYFLGRSGRHVCVYYDVDNFINYPKLKAEQQFLENEIIDYFNNEWMQEQV